jgi:phenylalanyl-tRNA synthetase beta chain
MKVSYSWLQTYFKDKLPEPSGLADLFNAHAFEVEGIETLPNDTVLDIKVLPDRAHYALSHRGIAREAAALSRLALIPEVAPDVLVNSSVYVPSVKVETDLCRRYTARRIDNVKIGESPAWLREHLESIGARSINNIVDATNFVMFALGQPLHAFDAHKVEGTITARMAKAGEKITVLDGREIALQESDIVIADDAGALAIGGVKGGKKAEVTASTISIILESANFNPTSVRKTSTRANLRNDSSKRFENEITPELAREALDRVTALILDLCSGSGASAVLDVYPKPVTRWTVDADTAYMNSVTGLSLTADQMSDILTRLRCDVEIAGEKLVVRPPFDRLDMIIAEDIADEIIRVYGYDKLGATETPAIDRTPVDRIFCWSEKAKNALVAQGFSEALLYSLVPKGFFEIAYPLASDKSALREGVSGKLAESLVFNARNAELLGLETIKMFEIGKAFPQSGEHTSLCVGVAQVKKRKGVTSESVLKEAIMSLEATLGIKMECAIEVGAYGAVAECDFGSLVSMLPAPEAITNLSFVPLPSDKRYKPFSQYPFMVRDVALFVPSSTDEADVRSEIEKSLVASAGNLVIKGPDCFDRFEKEGRKSLGFRMIFQSFERTLSDDEVNGYMSALTVALKARGWEVR